MLHATKLFGGKAAFESAFRGTVHLPCDVLRFAQFSVNSTHVTADLQRLVASGHLTACTKQQAVAARLDKLAERASVYEPMLRNYHEALCTHLSACDDDQVRNEAQGARQAPLPPKVPRGVYIHGPVGAGKSMLLDSFFHVAPCSGKARYHFHDFMARVHQELHSHNRRRIAASGRAWHISSDPSEDSVVAVGRKLANEHWLLAFDEFQVTDVADALIMSRLFNAMWSHGAVLVATSNRPPEQLYMNGLNRELFLPFVQALTKRCRPISLQSKHDWRKASPSSTSSWVQVTSVEQRAAALEQLLGFPLRCHEWSPHAIDLGGGRTLGVKQFAGTHTTAKLRMVGFEDVCAAALSPADFRLLVAGMQAVILVHVPCIPKHHPDWARRYIHLIDQAYENRVQLLVIAEASSADVLAAFAEGTATDSHARKAVPMGLSQADHEHAVTSDPAGVSHITEEAEAAALDDIRFAAARALSRLHEMSTRAFAQGAISQRVKSRMACE